MMSHDPDSPRSFHSYCYYCGIEMAAEYGDLELVRWFVEVHSPGIRATWGAHAAATNGHLHVLRWLCDEYGNAGITRGALVSASRRRRIDMVEWICRRWSSQPSIAAVWRRRQLYQRLIEQLSLPFLQWTVEIGWMRDRSALSVAANHDPMDFVEWYASRLDQAYHDMKARHDHGDCDCTEGEPSSDDDEEDELIPQCARTGEHAGSSCDDSDESDSSIFSNDDDRDATTGDEETSAGTISGAEGFWAGFPHVFDLADIATGQLANIIE